VIGQARTHVNASNGAVCLLVGVPAVLSPVPAHVGAKRGVRWRLQPESNVWLAAGAAHLALVGHGSPWPGLGLRCQRKAALVKLEVRFELARL